MSGRAKLGLVLLSLFSVVNLCGIGIAAFRGEVLHTLSHVVLLFASVYFIRRIASHTRQDSLPHSRPPEEILDHIQQSVDAVALDLERIGEAQRFAAKLQHERATRQQ